MRIPVWFTIDPDGREMTRMHRTEPTLTTQTDCKACHQPHKEKQVWESKTSFGKGSGVWLDDIDPNTIGLTHEKPIEGHIFIPGRKKS